MNGTWGSAIQVPGLAALNSGGNANLRSLSCATAGNCTASGSYLDGSAHHQAFVVDETNGTWGNAIEVPGTASLNGGGQADVRSLSCATAGNCAAAGYYTDGSGNTQAFVADESNSSWGNAIEVPGTAALNTGGYAEVLSVSCATVGNCAVGGTYADPYAQAFVANETNGSWGSAIEVPGTPALNSGRSAHVFSVSCPTAGNCVAGGDYFDVHGHLFAASQASGSWGTASELPGTANLNSGNNAELISISCATAGNCTDAGYYMDGSGHVQIFVADETNGQWGGAIEAPAIATLNSGGSANLTDNSLSCATAGNCAVGGHYRDGAGQFQAFVLDEMGGSWGNAIEVPGTASLNGGGEASANSVSCATANTCTAAGYYTDASGHAQAFVATAASYAVAYLGNGATGGSAPSDPSSPYGYGSTVTVLGAGSLTKTGYTFAGWNTVADGSGTSYQPAATFSMPASPVTLYAQWTANAYAITYVGNGATGGSPLTDPSSPYGYGSTVTVLGAGSLTKTGYTFAGWNTAANGSGTSYQPAATFSMPASPVTLYAQWAINAYAVTYSGNGATGGSPPTDGASPHNYGSTVTALGSGSLTKTGYTFAGWNTAANGSGTSYQPAATFPMPASPITLYAHWAKPTALRPGTTTCRGTYSGTGSSVVVPASATCTLVPGTYVKGNVTVKTGGALNISGVTIGGALTTSGSATVCGSKIGRNVQASGGSFALGGPACLGNKVTGNVLVQHDANRVTVQGNKISGSLTVNHSTGPTDSIGLNVVSLDLLVEYSGPPVDVSKNHARNALCTKNTGQTGSGNVAHGKNTCPH
jgi:uncharacterized repeat protein (TIGR02543 family)